MNVIVVDFVDLSIYKLLSNIKEINISAICVPFDRERDILKKIDDTLNIYTWADIVNWNHTHVSTDDINKYLSTQLKVERFYSRFSNQQSVIQSLYYQSLAFWNNILNDDISIIFIADQEHGIPVDSIPLAIAKEKGILAYTFEPIFSLTEDTGLYAIHNYNFGYYLNIQDASPSSPNIDVDELLFFKKSDPVSNISNLKKIMYLLLHSLKNKYICKKKENYFGIPRDVQIIKSIFNIFYIWKTKFYYLSQSVKNIPSDENYVLYALHFEPEATIMNRTIFNSQIYNIEMLSQAIPPGWLIYVKEHPDQLNIKFLIKNKFIDDNLSSYRSDLYYKKILSLPNVKLLNYRISSSKIMDSYMPTSSGDNCGLKAIATINGTISIEAIHRKIPVMLFDALSMPYADVVDVPCIKSYDDVVKCMDVISSPGFSPSYSGYGNAVGKYLVSYSRNKGFNIGSDVFEYIINCEIANNQGGQ